MKVNDDLNRPDTPNHTDVHPVSAVQDAHSRQIQTVNVGRFITVEGIDGSGKSTLVQGLQQWMLQDLRLPAISAAESFGYIGTQRTELQNQVSNLVLDTLNARTYEERLAHYFLFMANRSLMGIEDALATGNNIIMDRYIDSTFANYKDIDPTGDTTRRLHTACRWPEPNVTIMLLCDINLAAGRIRARRVNNDFNIERTLHTLGNAQQTFVTQAGQNRERIYTIDAAHSKEMVLDLAKRELRRRFGWHELSGTGVNLLGGGKWKKKRITP